MEAQFGQVSGFEVGSGRAGDSSTTFKPPSSTVSKSQERRQNAYEKIARAYKAYRLRQQIEDRMVRQSQILHQEKLLGNTIRQSIKMADIAIS